jgi:2-phosphosulfolactate phosphatase
VDVALVIDVLRATSVMTKAMAAGAAEITAVAEIDDAFAIARLARSQSKPQPLLCGERQCRPIDGFDLGNSPADYCEETVGGRSLVLTTTNGTRAIMRNASARQMLVVSFLNLSATAVSVAHAGTVHMVCAGTDGQTSGEDVLLAGAVIEKVKSRSDNVDLCDASRIALSFWQHNEDRLSLEDRIKQSLGARNMIREGYGDDLARCAAVDFTRTVVRRTRRQPATFLGESIS